MDLNSLISQGTADIKDIPVRILIVDDREDNHQSLELIWQEEDYEFIHANSGKEALRILLNDTDFTLIIMDVLMPNMDGFETASYIFQRKKLKDIPIIFLTARGSEDNLFKAYDIGAVDYISKPVIPELLRAKVNVFIELSKKNKILEFQRDQLKEINENLEKEIEERIASEKKVKVLNEQLNKKLEELESLDAFTYSVSHDLKNPLMSISILTQLLRMNYSENLDNEAHELIGKVEKQVQRLDKLIKDLLLFSRNGHQIEKSDVNMNQVVKEVIEEIKLTYQLDGDFRFDLSQLPDVKCDGDLIKQVWNNLISNAVKYSRDKSVPLVKIESHSNGDNIVYSVKDNGIGFDPKESDNLFKVFKRLESAKNIEGTGVGLAIVKRIIERHKGDIWVESVPGEGTTFKFFV